MRVSAFTRNGSVAASTRQRLLQYVPHLQSAGITVDYHPLLDDGDAQTLGDRKPASRAQVARSYARRMARLASSDIGDIVWVYAELFPYLPGWFEKLGLLRGKRIVYDLDDAFFHNYDRSHRPLIRSLLGPKFGSLLSYADACCCGNAYIRDYAAQFCGNTPIFPTVVDTGAYRPNFVTKDEQPVVIGWIGSPATWGYVTPYLPLLADLAQRHGVKFKVVGAGAKAERDRFPGLELVEWREATEVQEVQAMDIGIMPLTDHYWSQGKSGYKLIQYMACGLPVVASPVGANNSIVEPGISGYLADDIPQWKSALTRLITDRSLRERMGAAGRQRAEDHYSLKVHAPRLVELFRSL